MSNRKVVPRVRAKSGHASTKSTPLVFVGAGNLGGAVLKALVSKKVFSKQQIHVITATEKSAAAWRKWGVSAGSGDYTPIKKAKEVWLAVKPAQIRNVAPFVSANLGPSTKVISLLAGWNPENLSVLFRGADVVSVMTNTAARINAGLFAVFYAEKISGPRQKSAADLFNKLGHFCGFFEQSQMPVVTALIGSMPAFLMNLERQYLRYASQNGVSQALAKEWFAALMQAHQKLSVTSPDLDILIREIATPGGCTQKGLDVLDAKPALYESLAVCADRAKEMGA